MRRSGLWTVCKFMENEEGKKQIYCIVNWTPRESESGESRPASHREIMKSRIMKAEKIVSNE